MPRTPVLLHDYLEREAPPAALSRWFNLAQQSRFNLSQRYRLSRKRAQNGCLGGANAVPTQFGVEELRHGPRHPAQVEAHAVFHRRHIEFLSHLTVYIHTSRHAVNRIFLRGQLPRQIPSLFAYKTVIPL